MLKPLRGISCQRALLHFLENSAEYWKLVAQDVLQHKLSMDPNTNIAKNIIFFLGDGMSIPTVTAARIYSGQLNGCRGEEAELSFEKFPYVGLSKVGFKRQNFPFIIPYSHLGFLNKPVTFLPLN